MHRLKIKLCEIDWQWFILKTLDWNGRKVAGLFQHSSGLLFFFRVYVPHASKS